MESFKEKFVEEALEYLDQLEVALLKLESTPEDQDLIEQIFRIMHTLKGNSAMFGFNQIDQFTHQLETIYDLIRSGEMKVSRELFDLTLASVDHIGNLLDEDSSSEKDVQNTHQKLLHTINQIIEKGNVSEEKGSGNIPAENTIDGSEKGVRTYYINIEPDPDILSNGTNPLYLIDDFFVLGDCIAYPLIKHLPDLKDLDPEKCYTSWEVILSTKENIEAINEVFIFVDDRCKVDIQELSNDNLLDIPEFRKAAENIFQKEKEIGLEKFREITESVLEKEEAKIKTSDEPEKIVHSKNAIASIRVSSDKLDELMNLVSELVTNQASLNLLAENSKLPEIISIAENMEKVTRQLRDNTFDICLIPIDTIMIRFQRLVRDLSSELNKDVQLLTEGTETELDKNIIEGLADPIMHILRNSLDHGIESKEERLGLGKPEKGSITLKAFYSGMNVFIQIQDDGRGIDPEKIKQKAVSKGMISADTILEEKDVADLVFQPGFSTATRVTDVSGRGVGMDVVKRKISDIRGSVKIDSRINEGTTITIKLPLTLSIIDGLLVKINETFFVIQLPVVDKVYEIPTADMRGKFNKQIALDGELVPFLYLRDEFNIAGDPPDVTKIIVVNYDNQRIGLTVDDIIGEYQAVLKPLDKLFSRQDFVSGAAILGDGTVALVLDTNLIIDLYSSIPEVASHSERFITNNQFSKNYNQIIS